MPSIIPATMLRARSSAAAWPSVGASCSVMRCTPIRIRCARYRRCAAAAAMERRSRGRKSCASAGSLRRIAHLLALDVDHVEAAPAVLAVEVEAATAAPGAEGDLAIAVVADGLEDLAEVADDLLDALRMCLRAVGR